MPELAYAASSASGTTAIVAATRSRRSRSAQSTAEAAATATSTHRNARPDDRPSTIRCHCSAPSSASAANPPSLAIDGGSSAGGGRCSVALASTITRIAGRGSAAAVELEPAQLDPPDLAGERLRQPVDELDPARV